jgi:hypothetical protein
MSDVDDAVMVHLRFDVGVNPRVTAARAPCTDFLAAKYIVLEY